MEQKKVKYQLKVYNSIVKVTVTYRAENANLPQIYNENASLWKWTF